MNTIRRPRRSPRSRSVSFRTLWWLLAHEAALAVLFARSCATPMERVARAELCSVPTSTLCLRVLRRLLHHPARRYVP